jgi:hypothetical protein
MESRWPAFSRPFVLALIVFIVLLGMIVHRADAADATVNWTHPTQRTDNTPLAIGEIQSTEVQWIKCAAGNTWPASGTPASRAVAAPGTTTTITGLDYGTWCFRARTVPVLNPTTDQSDWTGTVWAQYLAPPKPPVLQAVSKIAYEAKIHPTQGLVAGRAVGTVELGTTCYADENGQPYAGADLYRVTLANVQLTKTPRSELLLAQCAAQG